MRFWPFHNERAVDVEAVVINERPRVYRIALAITSSHDAAEDVTQEVMCRFLRSADGVSDVRAWMRRVAIRCAAECRQTAEVGLPDEVTRRSPSPEETLAVAQTLAGLSPEHRTILALALMEGLSYREIADALDIPMGSVASRIYEAKKAFRRKWQA